MDIPDFCTSRRFSANYRCLSQFRVHTHPSKEPTQKGVTSMSTEEDMALVRRYAEEGWGKKNLAVVDELVAPDMVDHNPIWMMDQQQGAEGVKRTILGLQTAFPDLSLTIDEMMADKDKVALRWTIRGTHQGTLMGIAPTGKAVSWSG